MNILHLPSASTIATRRSHSHSYYPFSQLFLPPSRRHKAGTCSPIPKHALVTPSTLVPLSMSFPHSLLDFSIRSVIALLELLLVLTLSRFLAYFIIDEPHRDTQWVNNQANLIQWKKGLLDGIEGFDIEMARLTVDGLTLVAKNVPAQQNSLNIFLQDTQPGDDYFLIFLNSTHGVMHATSPRFTVLAAGSNPTNKGLSPNSAAPTVTVSGTPNPTKAFATTFPALAHNGAIGGWRGAVPGTVELAVMVLATLACIAAGGVWTMS